jgi:hypothetical protein
MFQACRPTGRLFYWVLTVVVVTASCATVWAREEASTGKPASSPTAKPRAAGGSPRAASPTPQSGPALTSVIDTVYMASGSPAQGVLVITWPAFVAADGTAVAPGLLNVTLGTNGALSVALTPNANATPANTYYTVVYQLQPAVAAREIIDPEKFKNGISMIIDGTVACLNASTWCKQAASTNTPPAA